MIKNDSKHSKIDNIYILGYKIYKILILRLIKIDNLTLNMNMINIFICIGWIM